MPIPAVDLSFMPVHPAVKIRNKFLVLPIPEVVAASLVVTDAEHHPLVSNREEVGTGQIVIGLDIRGAGHARHIRIEKVIHEVEGLHICGLQQGWLALR